MRACVRRCRASPAGLFWWQAPYPPSSTFHPSIQVVPTSHLISPPYPHPHPLYHHHRQILRHAVIGMLPKNSLRHQVVKKLRVFPDEFHPYEAPLRGKKSVI